jgi:hypothetical protein
VKIREDNSPLAVYDRGAGGARSAGSSARMRMARHIMTQDQHSVSSRDAGIGRQTQEDLEQWLLAAGLHLDDADGVEVGRAQTGWSSDPAAEEFKSLKPNRALLENIARQTGGEVISANSLATFVDKLPNLNAPITESVTTPLWDKPLVFLLALACFAAEWGLRRWKGMA